MMEFTDFADVNAVVLAAPTVVLVIFALAAAWMNHVPSRGKTANLAPPGKDARNGGGTVEESILGISASGREARRFESSGGQSYGSSPLV
jgi:hypothetical protein